MKRKIFIAYIDGSGAEQKAKGMYGYLITKQGIYLDPLAPVKESHWKPVIKKSESYITGNAAEYLALKELIEFLPKNSVAIVYSDSRLVVCQVGGKLAPTIPCRWKCRNPRLRKLRDEILEIIEKKSLDVRLQWIPREENKFGKVLERLIRKKRKHRRKRK